MTSFGRGRGWSSLPNKEQSLRRPGGLALANSVVKDIIDKINACDVHEHVSSQLIQEVVDLLTSSVNKENLKYCVFSPKDFHSDSFIIPLI